MCGGASNRVVMDLKRGGNDLHLAGVECGYRRALMGKAYELEKVHIGTIGFETGFEVSGDQHLFLRD